MALVTDLIQAIPAILTSIKGRDTKKQKQTSDHLSYLANAQVNMDSPMFKNLYQQNRQASQQNLAETVSEISRQNRKLNVLGRRPLLDQERGGESIFRNLLASQEGIDADARKNTFAQLGRGSDAYTGVYNAYSKNADLDYENKVRKAAAYGNIADVIRGATQKPVTFDPNDIATATAPKSDLALPMGSNIQDYLKKLMGVA